MKAILHNMELNLSSMKVENNVQKLNHYFENKNYILIISYLIKCNTYW